MRRPRPGATAPVVALLLSLAGSAAAQNPPPTLPPKPPPAAQHDTTQADTTEAPPTPPVRTLPLEIPTGPLPPSDRLVFTRDSVLWNSAYTLAGLLAEVPGVFVAHTGFVGQPAAVLYEGRGPASLEIYWDGVPLLPLGADSVAIDPGRISLFGLGRVEVERLPGLLRVYLVSDRSPALGSRSLLRIVSGSFKTGGYAGLFEYRSPSGLALNLLADYWGTQSALNPPHDAGWFDLRAKVEWTPSPLIGASAQIRRLSSTRDPVTATVGPSLPGRGDLRTETLIRLVASTRPERQGVSVEAGLQTTAWHADSGTADTVVQPRAVHRAFVGLRAAGRAASADLFGAIGDYYTPATARLRLGWVPLSWLVLSGDGLWARHDSGRTSLRGHAAVALFWRSLSLVGEGTVANAVAAPALAADTAQATTDLGARAGLASRRLTMHVGVERRAAFAPPLWPAVGIGLLPPAASAVYGVADLTATLGGWTVGGWVAQPVSGPEAAFDPSRHVHAAITFRSKFWRTFRSGAFDIKAQVSLDRWSAGVAGLDETGAPRALPAASIGEAFLQIQLVQFSAFYSLKNAFRSLEGYVPGFDYPRTIQSFGVKWTFQN